jgi:hypothetical protein
MPGHTDFTRYDSDKAGDVAQGPATLTEEGLL